MSNYAENQNAPENENTAPRKSIEETVVDTYKKIEDGVVSAYKKVEEGAVNAYKAVEDFCVDKLFKKEGETVEEAKDRLQGKK